MYCTQCGTRNATGAAACSNCGHPMRVFAAPPQVPNHLVAAIFVTLCCCVPFGIVSLVYAAQVNNKLAAGDIAGAQEASNRARTWALIALIAGILTGAGWALITMLQSS